ncbi:hypothetical protein [Actinomadura geliboluensis]|uniref:hypothetical protein n=1 Tax=Actinomadura geliboluensis TaxID=882440 RepID=UPI0014863668|nr:hypothetical protein [Actinomadura geliboluensis]
MCRTKPVGRAAAVIATAPPALPGGRGRGRTFLTMATSGHPGRTARRRTARRQDGRRRGTARASARAAGG